MAAQKSHIFCGMSELDYSPSELVQTQIEYGYNIEITPHNSIIHGNNIIFHIEGGTDWIDLANTFLKVEIRVSQADGVAIDDSVETSIANNVLHSIFSQVQVKLKDTVISHPSSNYSYRAYLENMLNFSPAAKYTWMQTQGWYQDESSKFETAENKGFKSRKALIAGNKILSLKGRLCTDISAQPLLIPSQTDVNFTLTPQRPEFAILRLGTADTKSYKIEILSALLNVRKVKLYPSAVNDFEKSISKNPVRLPISQIKVSTISIPRGLSTYTQNSLFHGSIPNYLLIGFLDNAGYSGNYGKNPFLFQHMDLNHIQLKVNDRLVPTVPFTPDFGDEKIIDSYESLFSVVGKRNQDWSNGLTVEDYVGGTALYGFVLNEDTLCRHDSSSSGLGHVGISVKFGTSLAQTVTMIIYSSVQASVIIDQYRNVLLDV